MTVPAESMAPGALRKRDRSMVVLPAPLRPIRAIFSPRATLAVNFWITESRHRISTDP